MPAKNTKKTAVKTSAAKKTTKKPSTKKVVVEEVKEVAPEMHECKCGANCKCGADCKCGCHEGCGTKIGRFIKKFIILLIVFALGFAAAKLCDNGRYFRASRVDFNNGCLDVSSVKCPALIEKLPLMDVNNDGCISKDEFRMFRTECSEARQALREARREAREEIREARQEVREEVREARQALAD